MAKKATKPKAHTGEVEQFFRLIRQPEPGDHWPGYRIEMIECDGEEIVSRRFIKKRDLKGMLLSQLEDIFDSEERYCDD